MNKKISGVMTFACILVLTFGFYCLLKLMTQKNDKGQDPIEAVEMSAEAMTPEMLLSLGRLGDPQMSPDGSRILYGVSYTSIEENRSCRQLFVCNADGSGRIQISHDGSSLSNARWLDDSHILFLQKGQLWKAALKQNGTLGRRTRLSDVAEGISEFRLSPDGNKIMYISTIKGSVKRPVDKWDDLQKADAYEADDLMHRHWDHWVTETPHSYIADFGGKALITKENSIDILGAYSPYELPTEPFGGLEQLSWSPDGNMIAYSCRKKTGRDYAFSTNTDIYVYDLRNGATVQITDGGGYDTDPIWSPDGSRLAWVSMERDGYEADQQRLMVAALAMESYNAGASTPDEPLISVVKNIDYASRGFDRNVASPVWEDASTIYFNALDNGLQGIFKAVDSGDGWAITKLTENDDWHDYSTPFHIDGKVLYATWQNMNRPTELVRIDLGKSGIVAQEGMVAIDRFVPETVQISDENGHLLDQLEEPRMEARMIETVDGKEMLTWVIYPPHFDPSRTYPAITICLGGPQGTNSQSWSYRWCYRLMAEQGYIVVLPNRRGTTAFGQEWCEQISGDYAGLNIEDYKSAARELKAEPYVGKMAACGASYGGYSVYYLAGHNEDDLFDCFIAHAGIFNEEQMYYTTEEMWFPEFDNGGLGRGYLSGSPWSKYPEAVRHYSMSPHKFVENWHTPILCIHGGMDFRIPYEQGMAAFNCARMMGVEAKMIVFPGENHWILQPQNALYWHRSYFDWLDRWCR